MRLNRFAIVTATALLGVLGGVLLCAQDQGKDKYSLISPDGIGSPTSGDTRTGLGLFRPPKKS